MRCYSTGIGVAETGADMVARAGGGRRRAGSQCRSAGLECAARLGILVGAAPFESARGCRTEFVGTEFRSISDLASMRWINLRLTRVAARIFVSSSDRMELGQTRCLMDLSETPNTEGTPFGAAQYRYRRVIGDWYWFMASDDWW